MRTPRPIKMKAEAAPSSADDHLDCAAHYGFAASVDAPHEEAYRARFNTTLDAWLAAHPAAASADARGEPAWRQAVADRMEALGAPVTQAGCLPQTDPDRASRLAVAFTRIWDGVRACDLRHGHAPLPAPFTWID